MIQNDVKTYIEATFTTKSYSELSKNPQTGESLIKSEKCEAFSFDDIVRSIFTSNPPASADAIRFHHNQIYLIEFKSGFTREITPKTYDPKKCNCPDDTEKECLGYKNLLFKNAELEVRELIDSIHLKAIDSRWILDRHIGAKCSEIDPPMRVNYIVVADVVKENPVEALDSMQCDLGKSENDDNMYTRLKKSLRHYSQVSSSGEPLAYDYVDVFSLEDFTMQVS